MVCRNTKFSTVCRDSSLTYTRHENKQMLIVMKQKTDTNKQTVTITPFHSARTSLNDKASSTERTVRENAAHAFSEAWNAAFWRIDMTTVISKTSDTLYFERQNFQT